MSRLRRVVAPETPRLPPSRSRTAWWWLVLPGALGGVVALYFHFVHYTPLLPRLTCKEELLKLGRAVERCPRERGGLYPKRLEELVSQGTLAQLPTCPLLARSDWGYRRLDGGREFSLECRCHRVFYRFVSGRGLVRFRGK